MPLVLPVIDRLTPVSLASTARALAPLSSPTVNRSPLAASSELPLLTGKTVTVTVAIESLSAVPSLMV
jgi:hypothetical protein